MKNIKNCIYFFILICITHSIKCSEHIEFTNNTNLSAQSAVIFARYAKNDFLKLRRQNQSEIIDLKISIHNWQNHPNTNEFLTVSAQYLDDKKSNDLYEIHNGCRLKHVESTLH